jgi:hypothetical protein
VNTLILPQLLYTVNVLYMPKRYVVEYNDIIIKSIWNDKPSKVKYSSLINTIENGGLRLQDLKSKIESLKIKWLKQLKDMSYQSQQKSKINCKFSLGGAFLHKYNRTFTLNCE